MHSKSRQHFAAVILFFVAVLMAASPRMALAHAVLLSSSPQKNAAVNGPELPSVSSTIRASMGRDSSLSLVKPDGSVEKIGALTQPLPDTLSATGHKLAKGAYVLRWQVLSSDGHITRGEVPFQVE